MKQSASLIYENIIEEFLKAIPEARSVAQEKRQEWTIDDERLPYIFFGYVVNSDTKQALARAERSAELTQLFYFFEAMASSSDKRVADLLTAGTLEVLGDDKNVLAKARTLMGNNTLALSHAIERSWGRE